MRVKKETIRNDTKKKKHQNKSKDPIYDAYQKYIKSKAFKELRKLVLDRDKHTCQVCGRKIDENTDAKKMNLQVHHRSYEHLGMCDELEMADLITLCNICHRSIHSAISNLRRFSDKSQILENLKKHPKNKPV